MVYTEFGAARARTSRLNLLWRREVSLPPAAKLGLHAWMRMDMGAAHLPHDAPRACGMTHEGLSSRTMNHMLVCGGDEKSPITTVSHVHEIMS